MTRPPRRRGVAALDAVVCGAVAVPIAAALLWVTEQALDAYFLTLGTVVGGPLM